VAIIRVAIIRVAEIIKTLLMYAKKFLNNVGEIKSKDTNTIISESTKGVITGATIGGLVGLVVGLGRKKNLLLTAFIGSLVGGSLTKIFLTKK
jgi:uncharacterized protein YcfJ